jgi:hypothetical protein
MGDALKIADGDFPGALMDRVLERAVRNERINQRAVHRLGGAPQRAKLNGPARFGFLKGFDGLRANAKPFRKLNAGHADCIPDCPYPAFGRRTEPVFGFQG